MSMSQISPYFTSLPSSSFHHATSLAAVHFLPPFPLLFVLFFFQKTYLLSFSSFHSSATKFLGHPPWLVSSRVLGSFSRLVFFFFLSFLLSPFFQTSYSQQPCFLRLLLPEERINWGARSATVWYASRCTEITSVAFTINPWEPSRIKDRISRKRPPGAGGPIWRPAALCLCSSSFSSPPSPLPDVCTKVGGWICCHARAAPNVKSCSTTVGSKQHPTVCKFRISSSNFASAE